MRVTLFAASVLLGGALAALELPAMIKNHRKREALVYIALLCAALAISGLHYLWPDMPSMFELIDGLFPGSVPGNG